MVDIMIGSGMNYLKEYAYMLLVSYGHGHRCPRDTIAQNFRFNQGLQTNDWEYLHKVNEYT